MEAGLTSQSFGSGPELFHVGLLSPLENSERFKQLLSLLSLPLLPATDEEVASLNMIKSAPVGPVAGGIMGCIMVLVLAVYAYRHQIHRRSHQHMSPLAAQGKTERLTGICTFIQLGCE